MKALGLALGALALVIAAKAAYVQVLRSGPIMGEGTLVTQADGERRYEYNPRFQEIMREIPKGSIYDRNGLPLATSHWEELEAHRAEYARLGIDIDRACSRTENRHYPFGGLTFDLLGDLRTRARWGASNTSFVERDYATRLRGYDDRAMLVEVKNPRNRQDASGWCATTIANWCRCCAIATNRTRRRSAACSTARATCTCRSMRACRCASARFCSRSCTRRARTRARSSCSIRPPAICWPR